MHLFSSIFLMISIVGLSIGFFDHDHNHHEGWGHDSHHGGFTDSGEWNGPSHEFDHNPGGFTGSWEGHGHSHEFDYNHGRFPDSGEWNGPSHECHHNPEGFPDSRGEHGPPHGFHHHHEGGFPDSGERNGHMPDNKNNTYEEILQKFIIADEGIKNFCANNSKVKPTIIFGTKEYTLKYTLTTTDVNVDVKITNKILKASVTLRDNQNTEVFTDVMILPDILNFNGANWLISNNELKIRIPYKVPLMTEFSGGCGAVNNNVINVPVAQLPAFEYRNNADTT